MVFSIPIWNPPVKICSQNLLPFMDYPYKIPYSKTKLYLLLAASLVFVGLCLWYISVPDVPFGENFAPLLIGVGIVGLLFFSLTTFVLLRMLLSGKLAIEINDEGIRDETSGIAVGLIRWEDIESFAPYTTFGNHFILVNVRNPEYYYERARGSLAKRAMRQNEKSLRTPVSLNCGSVSIPPEQLIELLRSELDFQRELEEGPGVSLAELIRQRNALFG